MYKQPIIIFVDTLKLFMPKENAQQTLK